MFNNVIETYRDVLSQVRQHIPNAVLVGGCLRDTFYGVEVKDLDFVVQTHNGWEYPVTPGTQWLRDIWPDKQFRWCMLPDGEYAADVDEANAINDQNDLLFDVIKSTDDRVNFIVVRDIPEYTNNFPDSISKLVFDGERVHYANEWMVGHNNGEVYYRNNIGAARLEKLRRKYPDWAFMCDEPVQQELLELIIE